MEQLPTPPPVTWERLAAPQGYCEQCGAPAVLRVVRWTFLNERGPERLPQQTHRYCGGHQTQAAQMELWLWESWHRRSPRTEGSA